MFCLFDVDFHCLMKIVYVNFILQFVVVVVDCRDYVADKNIGVASLFWQLNCILCSQHCNIKNEFVSLICSVINIFDFKCNILILKIVEIDFCAFMLNMVYRVNFDMLICNIKIIDLIFLHLKHLLVLEHFVKLKYEILKEVI